MTTLQTGIIHGGMASYAVAIVFLLLYIKDGLPRNSSIARAAIIAGMAAHIYVLLDIGVQHRGLPMANMLESSLFFSTVMMIVVLVIDLAARVPLLTVIAAPMVFCYLLSALTLLAPEEGAKRAEPSFAIAIHVTATLLSYVAFALAFISGIIYIVERRRLKAKSQTLLYGIFPSIEAVAKLNGRAVATGFILLTIGLFVGYFYGRHALMATAYWRYSPKVFLTTLTWAAYLVVMIMGFVPSARGRKVAIATTISFILVILTFWVTIFWKSFHDFL